MFLFLYMMTVIADGTSRWCVRCQKNSIFGVLHTKTCCCLFEYFIEFTSCLYFILCFTRTHNCMFSLSNFCECVRVPEVILSFSSLFSYTDRVGIGVFIFINFVLKLYFFLYVYIKHFHQHLSIWESFPFSQFCIFRVFFLPGNYGSLWKIFNLMIKGEKLSKGKEFLKADSDNFW